MSDYSLYISAFSFLVSFITLYLTQFQKPIISFHPGHTLGVSHTGSGFDLYAPITFVNSAQRTGIVLKSAVVISFPGEQSKYQYIEWTEFKNYDSENKRYNRETFAGPLAIAGKSSEHRIVLFRWKQGQVSLIPGVYRVAFYVWISGSDRPEIVSVHEGEISDQSAKKLNEFKAENKFLIHYFLINQQIESNKILTKHEMRTLLGSNSV